MDRQPDSNNEGKSNAYLPLRQNPSGQGSTVKAKILPDPGKKKHKI